MTAIDFPNSPTVGQRFTAGGITREWDGTVWKIIATTITGPAGATGPPGPQPSLSSNNPLMNGTASPGTASTASRDDHVHPTDTSRAPLASPTFTGTPAAPTAAVGTNTTQIATTEFVKAEIAATPASEPIHPFLTGCL